MKINDRQGRNQHRGEPPHSPRRAVAARCATTLLLLLDLRDGVAGLGEGDLIAGVEGIERDALHLELLHDAAAGANRAVLLLFNRDRAVEPVDLRDHPCFGVLREGVPNRGR